MLQIFQIVTVITGIIMSIGYFPQAYKIYKHKSAESISLLSYIIFALGTLIWTAYGVFTRDFVVVVSFSIGVVGSWLVLLLALRYRKGSKKSG